MRHISGPSSTKTASPSPFLSRTCLVQKQSLQAQKQTSPPLESFPSFPSFPISIPIFYIYRNGFIHSPHQFTRQLFREDVTFAHQLLGRLTHTKTHACHDPSLTLASAFAPSQHEVLHGPHKCPRLPGHREPCRHQAPGPPPVTRPPHRRPQQARCPQCSP